MAVAIVTPCRSTYLYYKHQSLKLFSSAELDSIIPSIASHQSSIVPPYPDLSESSSRVEVSFGSSVIASRALPLVVDVFGIVLITVSSGYSSEDNIRTELAMCLAFSVATAGSADLRFSPENILRNEQLWEICSGSELIED